MKVEPWETQEKLEDMFLETDEMVKLRIGCGLLIMLIILLVVAVLGIIAF